MPIPVYGTNGYNWLFDQPFGTQIFASGGNDVIYAHENDVYAGPLPWGGYAMPYESDYFNGGSGIDIVDYQNIQTSVFADLGVGIAYRVVGNSSHAPDTLVSIENLRGGDFNDALFGNFMANKLYGGNGSDNLDGRQGSDTILGEGGNDFMNGGSGNDTMKGGDGNDTMYGGSNNDDMEGGDNNDEMHGESGHDVMEGNDGNDELNGGSGNDDLNGGAGNDTLDGGSGTDTLDGGSGTDTATFHNNNGNVVNGDIEVNLQYFYAEGTTGVKYLYSIENVTTGNGNDDIVGNSADNVLNGQGGNDFVDALGGDDTVYGGTGNDTIEGGDDDDVLYGYTQNDDLFGEGGDDELFGGSGHDMLDGGAGDDDLDGGHGNDWFYGGTGFNDIDTGTGSDVVAYRTNNTGLDHVEDFSLANDRLYFENDFFAGGPSSDLDLVLSAIEFEGTTFLQANTSWGGWASIARFDNVDADGLNAKIEDESILFGAQVIELPLPDEYFG